MIDIALETHPIGILILIALAAYLLFFVKKRCKKTAFSKLKTYSVSTSTSLIFKTITFIIIVLLLSYLFNIWALINTSTPKFIENSIAELKAEKHSIDNINIILIWLLFLMSSLFHFSITSIIANLFSGFIFSSMYIYFNIQLSFAAIIVAFFSYYDTLNNTNFVQFFIVLFIAILTGLVFFKLKKYLLKSIRGYYLYIHTGSGITGSKIIEFYIVCTPYIIYSVLFSITILSNEFNILIQMIISHIFSYFIIYKLYRERCDIGFDYDPF